jgi:hypothetical protein
MAKPDKVTEKHGSDEITYKKSGNDVKIDSVKHGAGKPVEENNVTTMTIDDGKQKHKVTRVDVVGPATDPKVRLEVSSPGCRYYMDPLTGRWFRVCD